jgi:hypothetical protein
MTDNIDECEIDFDQLESEHKRILEKVKLDKALAGEDGKKEEKVDSKTSASDMIKLKVEPSPAAQVRSHWTNNNLVPRWDPNDTSTWSAAAKRVEKDSISMDEFDEIVYDPYDIGSGNRGTESEFADWCNDRNMPKLANTPDFNEWEAHAWPEAESTSDDDPAEAMDDYLNGNVYASGKFRVGHESKRNTDRPLSKYYQEQEEEDMMNVVYQSAEEIKYSVENLSTNVESLESEVQEISTTTTFISNNVSGMERIMKKLETEVRNTRQELKHVRSLLEIIVQYYTEDSTENSGEEPKKE